VALAVISRIVENCGDGIEYKELHGLMPHLMAEIVGLYNAEEK
jgi:hypothetical protein